VNWTVEHWTNFGLFVGTILLTGLGQVDKWGDIMNAMTPASVGGFGLACLTFLKTMYTNRPRDPQVGERRTDPLNTVPVVERKTFTGTTVVPAVVENPGRPVDDQKPPE